MNIANLEDLWAAQRPANDARRPDPAELSRRLAPELRRRSRLFGYEFFSLGLGLLLTPLLAVVNFLHQRPEYPVLYWINPALVVAVIILFLAGLIRRARRHRELAQTRSDTVAAFAAKALATIEAEGRDYRAAFKGFTVWFGLALLAIYVNHPVPVHGWQPLGVRVALLLGFFAVVGGVSLRHYRKNVLPEWARRKELLAQLQ